MLSTHHPFLYMVSRGEVDSAGSSEPSTGAAPFVEFEVSFGAKPTLIVTFMSSYEGTQFGDAWLKLNGHRYRLRAREQHEHVTQTRSEYFLAYQAPYGKYAEAGEPARGGFLVKPHAARVRVRVELIDPDTKFVLVGLTTC